MNVDVRTEPGGLVLIGTLPAGPAGIGVVAIPAGEIHIDPTAPDDPPYAVIHDVGEAAGSIAEVYGPELAAAAMRAADGSGTSNDAGPAAIAELPLRPGRSVDAVRVLGLLTWLEDWSPDVLPSGILDIELGTTALILDDTLADHALETAEARLVARAGLVSELSRRIRDASGPAPPPTLSTLIAQTVPLLRTLVAPHDRYYADLEHEDELGQALASIGLDSPRLDWSAVTDLPLIGTRELVGTSHLGDAVAPDGTPHVGSVDWYQVPRGLLDTAEDTVLWSVTGPANEPRVSVSVRARPGGPDSDRLAFRLYAEGRPLPIADGRLRRSADGTEFVGRAPVYTANATSLVLDVYDALDTRPPRLGSRRTSAQAMRWAARAVSGIRLGDRSADSGRAARGGLEEAARLFASVAETSTDPVQHMLAHRRRARCTALIRAILIATGQQRVSDQMGRRRTRPSDGVREPDTRLPDIARSGWNRLTTEQLLLADPIWSTG